MAIGVLLAVGLTTAQPVAAACAAPSILAAPSEVGRGQQVQVTGLDWATECNDVNPSPEDKSGAPVSSVDLVIVQGEIELVVGNAKPREDYGFSTAVAVPAELAPGDARLEARAPQQSPGGYNATAPLVITEAEPVDAPPTTTPEDGGSVTTTSPVGAAADDVATVVDGEGNGRLPILLGLIGGVVTVLIVGLFASRARNARR